MNELLNNPIMQILIALVVVSFVVLETQGWLRAFRRMRVKREAGEALPELPLARIFSFLMNCAGYADAALITLIAIDMLAGTPFESNSLLLALPLTIAYLAYLISGPLRVAVVAKFNLRGGLLISAGGTLLTFAFVAVSVLVANFWAYVATVFVNRFFFYLLVSCVRFMPTIAESEYERIEINTETDNADISASALIGLLAGFAAQYFGSVYVYLIAMLPCAVLIGMIWYFIPHTIDVSRKTPTVMKLDFRRLRGFLLHPSILSLFFFALITLGFSACYRSYLFPIFANDAGLNKAAISTLMVFCNAFVFYFAPPLTRLAHRTGPRNLLTVTLAVCALAFLGFLVSSSIIWAIAALFLVLLVKKVGEPCARTLWPRTADVTQLSRAEGQAAYEVIDGIICFAKMPITGALLSFGQLMVCIVFGTYATISALAFWFSTRSGPFAK